MAYRKLGRDNKHRRSMLSTLTKQVIVNESITTTETRAKEVRKFVDKMITYGKKGDLVSRRKALALDHNSRLLLLFVLPNAYYYLAFLKILTGKVRTLMQQSLVCISEILTLSIGLKLEIPPFG